MTKEEGRGWESGGKLVFDLMRLNMHPARCCWLPCTPGQMVMVMMMLLLVGGDLRSFARNCGKLVEGL